MVVYHEIEPPSLHEILDIGIKRTTHGSHSVDSSILVADKYLDSHRPDSIKHRRISRANNIYAFLGNEKQIISIKDGGRVSTLRYSQRGKQLLVRLEVDPKKCFVSDLDLYDTLRRALELKEQDSTLENLAYKYWDKIIRLDEYIDDTIARPEVMITYNVPPENISLVDHDEAM